MMMMISHSLDRLVTGEYIFLLHIITEAV